MIAAHNPDLMELSRAVEVLYAEVRALREALRAFRPDPLARQRAAIALLKQTIADIAAIPVSSLDSRARPAHIALARQLCMKLMRERLGLSTLQIARCLGNRDHSGISQGIRRFNELLTIRDSDACRLFKRATEELAQFHEFNQSDPCATAQGT